MSADGIIDCPLQGNIESTHRVTFETSANFQGTLKSKGLIVQPAAQIKAYVEIGPVSAQDSKLKSISVNS